MSISADSRRSPSPTELLGIACSQPRDDGVKTQWSGVRRAASFAFRSADIGSAVATRT